MSIKPASIPVRGGMTDEQACKFIVDFVYEQSRIRLHDGKEALIRSRLGKRMRALGHESLAQYCEYLKNCNDPAEFTQVLDTLTTNFTSFLREEEHFKFLVNQALPTLLMPGQKQFSVWSAACSSGEEPYSLGFYLSEFYPPVAGWQWDITASDISTKVLDAAQRAIYAVERVKNLPGEWLRRYFQVGVGEWAKHYRVKKQVTERVRFRQLNLTQSYEHDRKFQVIFCRNVMIYFNRETQQELVQRMCRHLVPGGYLLIGHSESLHGLGLPLNCLRPSVYQLITS